MSDTKYSTQNDDELVKGEMLTALKLWQMNDQVAAKKSIKFVVGYLIVKELLKLQLVQE